MKHFILFLLYTWTASVLALLLFAVNYFFCNGPECEYYDENGQGVVQIQLVRAMTILCTGSLLFTSSMLVSVTYGILTGVGTIDRLKRKVADTWHTSTDEPTNLRDIFGIGPVWTWWLPIDPVFDDYDRIMGYATLQRLLRRNAANVIYDNYNNQRQQQQQQLGDEEGTYDSRNDIADEERWGGVQQHKHGAAHYSSGNGTTSGYAEQRTGSGSSNSRRGRRMEMGDGLPYGPVDV